jgi:F-type H+-transporting ATPase subunit b
MNIDWFTLVAQIVNFLILVALLKYFLYDRIVKVMDDRQESIRRKLQDADRKKEDADQELKDYRQKQEDLESEKDKILKETRKKAEEKKEELLKQAKKEVDQKRRAWIDKIEQDKDDFMKQLRRETGNQVYQISRRVLSDLADRNLEKQVVKTFLHRLENLEQEEADKIRQALKQNEKKIIVKSSFKLSEDLQKEVTDAFQDKFSDSKDFEFKHDGDVDTGIEMKIGDQKISWNIRRYLDSLEERFQRQLEEAEMVHASGKDEKKKEEDSGEESTPGQESRKRDETDQTKAADKKENNSGKEKNDSGKKE